MEAADEAALEAAVNAWHPVGERLMVVEQDATWPQSQEPVRVATVFRVAGGKVTAALRLPDLRQALEPAYIRREMAATDRAARPGWSRARWRPGTSRCARLRRTAAGARPRSRPSVTPCSTRPTNGRSRSSNG
mgnify:CR=1 FL=1